MNGEIELAERKSYDSPAMEVTEKWVFEINTVDMTATKLRHIQGGETYRTFDVPAHVEEELNELGFEVQEP